MPDEKVQLREGASPQDPTRDEHIRYLGRSAMQHVTALDELVESNEDVCDWTRYDRIKSELEKLDLVGLDSFFDVFEQVRKNCKEKNHRSVKVPDSTPFVLRKASKSTPTKASAEAKTPKSPEQNPSANSSSPLKDPKTPGQHQSEEKAPPIRIWKQLTYVAEKKTMHDISKEILQEGYDQLGGENSIAYYDLKLDNIPARGTNQLKDILQCLLLDYPALRINLWWSSGTGNSPATPGQAHQRFNALEQYSSRFRHYDIDRCARTHEIAYICLFPTGYTRTVDLVMDNQCLLYC